jgi:hypothetical protein
MVVVLDGRYDIFMFAALSSIWGFNIKLNQWIKAKLFFG